MNRFDKIKSKLTITKLLVGTVIVSTISVALIIGGLALEEIYTQKSRDVWSMIYLDLEKTSERLSIKLKAIKKGAMEKDKSVFDLKSKVVITDKGEQKIDSLRYKSGLKIDANNLIDLSIKKKNLASNKEEGLLTVGINKGSGFFIEQIGGKLHTQRFNLSALIDLPENVSTSSEIYLVNRSEYLLYTNSDSGGAWIKRKIVQDYIRSPLWQGQFEYENGLKGGALMHGFFQEIRGTNLILFVEVPVTAVLVTILDPTRKFLAFSGILLGVFTLLLYFPIQLLTKPVGELNKIAHKVGRGDFTIPEGEMIGEFGVLMESFRKMAHNLTIRDKKIAKLAEQEKEKIRLEAEMNLAKVLQENFVPATPLGPDVQIEVDVYYRVATEVAGDWYYYLHDPFTGNTVVTLVDVSGHGMTPGMMTALIAGLLNETAKSINQHTIPEFYDAVNRSLLKLGRRQWHATAISVYFEKDSHKLTLYNAGHVFPVKVSKDGKTKYITGGSSPLGLEAGFSIREKQVDFDPGDKILLYSDGLTEARNTKDKMYGRKRLSNNLSKSGDSTPEQMLKKLIDDWDTFRGPVAPEDDTCIMAIYKR